MSDTTADEVRKRQLECLMSSMQRDGASLHNSSWHIFIDIVASVVAQDSWWVSALLPSIDSLPAVTSPSSDRATSASVSCRPTSSRVFPSAASRPSSKPSPATARNRPTRTSPSRPWLSWSVPPLLVPIVSPPVDHLRLHLPQGRGRRGR